jgi:hypothetical protein
MNPNPTDETTMPGTATDRAPRATAEPGLGGDLLRGADAIAEFLFGDPCLRRKVYYLTSERRAQLPHFRLGTIICARKSTLVRWIEAAEARGSVSGQA